MNTESVMSTGRGATPLRIAIIGASGYTGEQLIGCLLKHPHVQLTTLMVSERSIYHQVSFSDLYPRWKGLCDLPLMATQSETLETLSKTADVVFLATDHNVSMTLAPGLLAQGLVVIDLSGAFRLSEPEHYPEYYGFDHLAPEWLTAAAYGLPEWYRTSIQQAQLIAAPGCYPTSAVLALKPLAEQQWLEGRMPIINAVSGVSGAGKKPSETTSYCEVSLKPYGSFTHRHQVEIDQYAGIKTLFQPHLGPYPRGILTTVYAQLPPGIDAEQVAALYHSAYNNTPCVRVVSQVPCIAQVERTPFCDLSFRMQGQTLILFSVIDNLLKGAASQAVQCMNLRFGFNEVEGLL